MAKIEQNHLWCPIDLVIHVIGSRWTIAIVRDLAIKPRRPSELSKSLNGISAKTLTQRLRDLEEWKLVKRTAYQEIPPRVEYELTERGRDLLFVLEALKDLGESWQRSLNIEVPAQFKEQCSRCFEYLDRDGALKTPCETTGDRQSTNGDGDVCHDGRLIQGELK
jgi:DNA-binding HxlR family transcriptional regulator